MNDKIFIQIAAYRDPELVPTIIDCLQNAKHPENLVFCIAWQHSKEDSWDNLDDFKSDSRFKIIDIDYTNSKGACWARNLIQQQYTGEKYTLQLDSHHRFIKNWDVECINMLTELQKKGYKKPLLTAYLPSYDPKNDPEKRVTVPWKMNFDRFIPEGAIFFLPATIDNWESLNSPLPARFYSAHFCFTLGQFCDEVQHDPEYYFHGEEISIAVRAFTHGYDLFHPHKIIAWHEYTRVGRIKQWDDDKKWGEKNNFCHLKNRKLFEMDGEKRDIDFGKYGFGKKRTLEEYQKYAGINFAKRAVQKHTLDNNPPPNPQFDTTEEYNNSWSQIFKHCIDIHKSQLQCDDYEFWAVVFEDENNTPLYREDATSEEIKQVLTKTGDFTNLWRTFEVVKRPTKWVVWPYSKSKGWVDKIQGSL